MPVTRETEGGPARGVNNGRGAPWTRSELIDAGVRWADRFDQPPSRREWEASQIRKQIEKAEEHLADLRAREREWTEGGYPGLAPILRVFETWPAFIKALGFTPHAGAGRPTDEARAWHREQAQALRDLGPVHLRVLDLLKRGAPVDHGELKRLYMTGRLANGGEDELRQSLGELIASGMVSYQLVVKHVYRLTAKGREELERRKTPAQRQHEMATATRDARANPVGRRRPA